MADSRTEKFARILVDYSTNVQPGDRVLITSNTSAEEAVKAIYARVLDRGGYPYVLMEFEDQEEIFFRHAQERHYDWTSVLHKTGFDEFEALIKVRAPANTRSLSKVSPELVTRRYKSWMAPLLAAQMRRGASGELRWMSTIFPNQAYAMEAETGLEAYKDFFFGACHADDATPDPIAYWQNIEREQRRYVERFTGHDQVVVRGPHVDLRLSVKDRIWMNSCGKFNMPDGEIYTGPVENSANGWVRFTYPLASNGFLVENVELNFQDGKVVKASATKNEALLMRMLDSDAGARYLGEFAIGTNYQIDHFTANILFDEKIGGSFHMAVGAGYPETGSHNKSAIHWDMICDMRQDSEILLDGELVYKNGAFTF